MIFFALYFPKFATNNRDLKKKPKQKKNLFVAGINGGYYSGALQQAHSTTPHEVPHSAGTHPPSGPPPPSAAPPPVPSVAAVLQPGLVSKSVSLFLFYFEV